MTHVKRMADNCQEERLCRQCWKRYPLSSFHKTTSTGANCAPGATSYKNLRRDCTHCRSKYAKSKHTAMKKAGFPERPPLGTKCALCPENSTLLVRDHCHVTDTLRKPLCHSCNLRMGKIAWLRSAYEYSVNHLLEQGYDAEDIDPDIASNIKERPSKRLRQTSP